MTGPTMQPSIELGASHNLNMVVTAFHDSVTPQCTPQYLATPTPEAVVYAE